MQLSEQQGWRFGWLNWLLLAAGLVTVLLGFADGLSELLTRWDKQEEYSHGYMIPLITLYFIWQRKPLLEKTDFTPTWWGLVLVALAVFSCLIGEISAMYLLIHYGFVLILVGMAWSMMGWPALKIVLIPLLLLLFAIPIPYFLEAQLSANLQLLSSKLGVYFIRWCQIPVYLEGNLIDLGSYKLQVVEACSGLRYLFPLMSLGFICAYMFDTTFTRRAIVFLSTIPITLLMNSFRIGMIGLLVNYFGIAMAEGFVHDFEGWVVFMACLGLLIIEMMLLIHFSQDKRSFSEVFGLTTHAANAYSAMIQRPVAKPFIAGLVLITLASISINMLGKREEVIPSRKLFVDFPMTIQGWYGKQESLGTNVLDTLKLSDYVLADYQDQAGKLVNFYVAYYATQRKGESPHSPQVCIPGGGWEISALSRNEWNAMPFNRIVIKKRRC
ncbi:VPLPA-CTERM-specific exosortase XrtD [Methylocucumis oryzae]|uniref:VPLPA-CTERM-specific exosortase XrtD n=1 Tax=Methylocucumis oryzae TaxID=1632867 RepID=UPI000ADEFCD7|nr:VPLPA-CTERM-specific exosortase XrtD [Methylocucumis oryzae]